MNRAPVLSLIVAVLVTTACADRSDAGRPVAERSPVDPAPVRCEPGCLSPADFDSVAWTQAWETFDAWAPPEAAVVSSDGMVVDASVAPAAMAGAAALEAGGSTVDAVLASALTGIVAGMGAPVSLAGVSALVYHDAASGTTHYLDGGWQTVAGEADLQSVPLDRPTGRAILVPGFMAAAEAAHQRFGRLPLRAVFEPAITVAEEGFVLSGELASAIAENGEVLGRLPETRAIFTGPGGSWLREGDVLRQPALAETLRRLATDGASYMYEGPWAQKLVAAVQRDGGHLTLADLAAYEAEWSETATAAYGPYQIRVPGGTATGGTALIEAMHLLDRAGVRGTGPVGESAASLYWMSRIGYLLWAADFRLTELGEAFPELTLDAQARRSPDHADRLWQVLQTERWDAFVESDPYSTAGSTSGDAPLEHTDAIVAVDRWGNVAAFIHTSNVVWWGRTGLFVDGVSVPDAGTLGLIRSQPEVGAGGRVSIGLNPILVLRDGAPVFASAALGAGIHHSTVQTLMNILDFDMDPVEAIRAPQTLHFAWRGAPGAPPGTPVHTHLVEEGRIPAAVLDSVRARGQPLIEVPPGAAGAVRGRLGMIRIDPSTGVVSGLASLGGMAATPGTVRR